MTDKWRVTEISPWFVPRDSIPRQFFRVHLDEGESVSLIAMQGRLDCVEHLKDADCLCRKAVRDSQLLNDTAPLTSAEVL